MSYGPDLVDQFRRAASYVDRILKGEKPNDLPVQAPTKYELVVNLKAGKAPLTTTGSGSMVRVDQSVICHPLACFVPFLYFGRKAI